MLNNIPSATQPIRYIKPAEVLIRLLTTLESRGELRWSEPQQETGPSFLVLCQQDQDAT